MNKVIITWCLCLFTINIFGQELKLFEWGNLFSYRIGYSITATDNYVVYNVQNGILFINKSDPSENAFYSITEDLSETEVQDVCFNPTTKKLLVLYASGAFDIIDENRNITAVRDIATNVTLATNKKINSISVFGNNFYLCFPFGMIEFNSETNTFTNTLQMPLGAGDLLVFSDGIYINSTNSTYYLKNEFKDNLSYFGNWQDIGSAIPAKTNQGLVSFDQKTYTICDKKLVEILPNQSFDVILDLDEFKSIRYIKVVGDYLGISGECNNGCLTKVVLIDKNLNKINVDPSIIDVNLDMEFTGDKIWFADSYGHFRYINLPNLESGRINLNAYSPYSNKTFSIKNTPLGLIIASGGYGSILNYQSIKDGFSILKEGIWIDHNGWTDPFYSNPRWFEDAVTIDVNPNLDEVAIGSMQSGLLILGSDGSRKIFNESNSSLRASFGDNSEKTRVGRLAYDKDGNLWIANTRSPQPLVVFTPNKVSKSFSNPSGFNDYIDITIDPIYQYKWMVNFKKGITVFDEGEDLISTSDDRWKEIPIFSDFLESNVGALSIYSDQNGRIYVGTESGIFILDCNDVFEECEARYPYYSDNGKIVPFMDGIQINDITEDGARRKWFATNKGIFVTTAEVSEIISHFNAANYPLASDNVLALDFDKQTGKIYISTLLGAQVYQTETAEGKPFHDSQLEVYPNPVKPNYTGPIVIKGLAEESSVKITDINGKLVFETISLGNQAIWYGKDLKNRKVASGVYLIYGTTTQNLENIQNIIGKVIFIK